MYMRFDPYQGLSRDEIIRKTYAERMTPDLQAKARRMAEERGITLMELFSEMAAEYDRAMADPIRREEWLRIADEMTERELMPFGPDPMLQTDDSDDDLNQCAYA